MRKKKISFKQLVRLITEIETVGEFDETCGEINRVFDRDGILPDEYAILYRLLNLIDRESLPDIVLHGRRTA